jgi:methylmalonyl-CoA mutase
VNTFRDAAAAAPARSLDLARSTEEEKRGQLERVRNFQSRHAEAAGQWLQRLREATIRNDNVFEVLMGAVRHCSLGQISNALFEVGGRYRRSM